MGSTSRPPLLAHDNLYLMKWCKGETKEDFNKRAREYMKKRYRKRIQAARERLGGCCVWCGSVENLHFDHIDPSTKEMLVSEAVYCSEVRFWAEVEKCQLLCLDCHTEKSSEDGSNSPSPDHGERSKYASHGCRCEACTKAQRDYMRKYLEKKRMEGTG